MIDRFLSFVEDVSDQIHKSIENGDNFLVLSANTPDGLASSILLLKFFYENDIEAHFKFVDIIDDSFFQYLFGSPEKSYDQHVYIFLDLGSRFIGKLYDKSREKGKKIIVIDHHDLLSKSIKLEDFYQLNPNAFGIDGKKEASTSSIVYFLLKSYGFSFKGEEILGLAGAISERQDIRELSGLNKYLLEDLVDKELVEVKKSIKLMGFLTKPLYKVLSSSLDIYIPGISGSDKKSIEFLKRIFPNKDIEKLYFSDLKPEEEKKLINEIIKIRVLNDIMQNEKIVGDIYLLRKNNNIFGDLKELSFLLASATALNKQKVLIKYFIKGDNIEDIKKLETYFRNKISSIISDIISGKIYKEEKDGILFLKISQGEGESYVPYIADIIAFNDIFDKRYYITYSEIGDYYEISVRKGKRSEEAPKPILSLIDKYQGKLSGKDNLCGFYIKKSRFMDFKDNLSNVLLKFY